MPKLRCLRQFIFLLIGMVGVGGCTGQHSHDNFVTDLSGSVESRWPESKDQQTEETILSREIPAVKFTAEPLRNVLQQLEKQAGITFVADWKNLAVIGTLPTSPVTFAHNRAPLGLILHAVLASAAAADSPAETMVWNGKLIISTVPAFQDPAFQSTRVYDVRDLVDVDYDIVVPPMGGDFSIHPTTSPAVIAGGGGGIFSQTQPSNPALSESKYPHTSERDLLDFITGGVDPETWRDNGGEIGSIRSFAGRFVVHQTELAHRKIRALLVDFASDHLKIVQVYDVRPLLHRDWGTDREKIDRLRHLLTTMVSPVGSYDFASMGTIDDFNGRIYISAPMAAQLKAERILRNCLIQ